MCDHDKQATGSSFLHDGHLVPVTRCEGCGSHLTVFAAQLYTPDPKGLPRAIARRPEPPTLQPER